MPSANAVALRPPNCLINFLIFVFTFLFFMSVVIKQKFIFVKLKCFLDKLFLLVYKHSQHWLVSIT